MNPSKQIHRKKIPFQTACVDSVPFCQWQVIRFTATIRGFRSRRVTLVTTLTEAQLYPAAEIIALYARRWRLELCLRDLKTTLGMEQLRCKTPDMAEKELCASQIFPG